MCGIAGILGVNRSGVRIEDVLYKIRHRGPNGLFYWKQDDIAFGHARLSIIDLGVSGNQPMTDPSTGNTIIFNGEIFNYIEIKKELGDRYPFITSSDTEVILAAYKIWGIDFLQKLRGMFAIAIYDATNKKVLLARDRIGIKPLYYRRGDGYFLFASEIKAIVNLPGRAEKINEIKAYEFLANRQLDTDERTFFDDVFQLPPAHYVWADSPGLCEKPRPYWDFPAMGKRKFDAAAKEEFIACFDDTVRVHMRSDVTVGSFLSGGIDSSSVTCFALRNMDQTTLPVFSAILPYFHAENSLIGDVLSAHPNAEPHQFTLSGDSFFDDIRSVIYHHDEPILDGSVFSHYKLCELAGANNVRVLLSGAGGDELFGGYSSHIESYLSTLLRSGRFLKYAEAVKAIKNNSSNSYKSLLSKSVYESMSFSQKTNFKNRQLKKRSGHLDISPEIKHYYFDHPDRYYANLVNNYKSWTAPPYLHYEDRNCMAFGTEVRVPFYDHKLIEFILQFSPDQVIAGSSKSILRNSFKGIVPDKILSQKGKYGFPSPIDHALKADNRGRELFMDLYKGVPFLDPNAAEKLATDFYNGKADLGIYWRALSYVIWYNIFFRENGQFA